MTWLASIKGYLIAAAVAVVGILAALAGARKAGRDEAMAAQRQAEIEAARRKKESDDEVDKMGDAAVDDELSRWLRDKR